MLEYLKNLPSWDASRLKREGRDIQTRLEDQGIPDSADFILKYTVPAEKIQEYRNNNERMLLLLGQVFESYSYLSFLSYYLSHKLGEECVATTAVLDECLAYIGKSQLWSKMYKQFRAANNLDKLVNTPLRKTTKLSRSEQMIEFAKRVARCQNIVTVKRDIGPEQRKLLKNYKLCCVMTGEPLGDCNDPISAIILFFKDRKPSVYLYRDISEQPSKLMLVIAVRNFLFPNV